MKTDYSFVEKKWKGLKPQDMTEEQFEEYTLDLADATEKASAESFKEKENWAKKHQEQEEEKVSKFLNKPILLRDITEDEVKKDWIWETLIAKGHTTLISASPKDGKSTFVRCFLKAVLEGTELAGEPVSKCRVLIISEESKSEWYEEGEAFGLLDESLQLWLWSRPFSANLSKKEWVDFIKDIATFCDENQIDLVIMDSLTAFWPVLNENDNSEATQALKAFYALTEKDIAVFLVHHDSKHGGINGKSIRGASSILQYPDQAIMFARLPGTNENDSQRSLRFRGRLREDETPIVINYDVNNYQYNLNSGSIREVSKDFKMDMVLSILKSQSEPLSIVNIHDLWDETFQGRRPNIRSLRRYVSSLIYAHKVQLISERLVVKKKTPFYGLVGQPYQLLTEPSTPILATVHSSKITKDSENNVVHSTTKQDQKTAKDSNEYSKEDKDDWDPRI